MEFLFKVSRKCLNPMSNLSSELFIQDFEWLCMWWLLVTNSAVNQPRGYFVNILRLAVFHLGTFRRRHTNQRWLICTFRAWRCVVMYVPTKYLSQWLSTHQKSNTTKSILLKFIQNSFSFPLVLYFLPTNDNLFDG